MPQNPLQMLQDLFKTQVQSKDVGFQEDVVDIGNGMTIRRPPLARRETQVLGGTDFANSVEDLFRKVPELRGRAATIQHGPTAGVVDTVTAYNDVFPERRLDIGDFPRLNLTGLTSVDSREIAVNPRLNKYTLPLTVGHEMGHAVGVDHGPIMKTLHEYLDKVFGIDKRFRDNNIMADPSEALSTPTRR